MAVSCSRTKHAGNPTNKYTPDPTPDEDDAMNPSTQTEAERVAAYGL